MNVANQHNLIRCKGCNALYDKTVKWVRGYTYGTSEEFTTTSDIKENTCPVCGKEQTDI